jgi:hypothetical protein
MIWDLEQMEEPLIAASGFTEDNHLEPITKVFFVQKSILQNLIFSWFGFLKVKENLQNY